MHHQVFSIRFVQAPVWGSVKKPTSFTVRVTVIFTGTFRVRLRARIRVRARFRVMVRVRIHNSSQGCSMP